MKKTILALACLLLLTNTYAQKNNSLLWEISGNGLKAPSYLFGTYHFAGKKLADSLSGIKKYFGSCKAIVGEILMDSAAITGMADQMMLKDSLTLQKLYTPAEYKTIGDYTTATTGMNISTLNLFKPSVVQLLISQHDMVKTFGPDNPPIDMYFQQEGKRLNDKVLAFETMQEQTELIFGAPIAEQKKQLLDMAAKKEKFADEGRKLYALYLQQDLDGIEKMVNAAMAKNNASPELGDKMLKNRNLKWITKAPGIMNEQPSFIVVGAAHLVGQYGLINQLRLKGYTVKPVKI
ncbi:TraB/GumN family protein [Mucilaginibacter panaciglaebae]|uniref:TraB/GumN family protein n=1 Tax=Mucilaginibacter panaciglaebae TaxID=502331 RepID=A0ABP7WUZ5_9SPHI